MKVKQVVAIYPNEVINVIDTINVENTLIQIVGEKLVCQEIEIYGLDRKGVRYEIYYNEEMRDSKKMANRAHNFINGVPQSILYGPIVLIKRFKGNYSSLDNEEIELIGKEFNSFQRDPWANIRNEIEKRERLELQSNK